MKNIFLQITSSNIPSENEASFLPLLKPILNGRANVFINNISPEVVTEVAIRAKEKGCKYVATSDPKLLKLLLGKPGTIDDYAGSIIPWKDYEFLIIHPLMHLATVSHGRHICERYFDKFLHPEKFVATPEFDFEIFDHSRMNEYVDWTARATFIGCDIETTGAKSESVITCIGFTFVQLVPVSKSFTARTVVIPLTDMFAVTAMRNILASAAPKVFQNGKYDIAHLLRYSAPVRNYAFDTINLFHCWYSELPKDLGSINAYLLRDWLFHKGESKTSDLYSYYRYNAKDAFTTAMSLLALLQEVPPYVLQNYQQEFPLVFPCILAEATGIKADSAAVDRIDTKFKASMEVRKKQLQQRVGNTFFNPSSSQQTLKLMNILGCGDLKSSGKIDRGKAAARHPLNKKLLTDVEKYREDRKLVSTYTDKEKIWNGRWYFALNPHGTDTGRLASRESQFWCGLQIQNIPRDRTDVQIKDEFISDPGFFLGEADGEQAEARDTAYLSGDTKLIEAVESSRDYHGINAERFFGIPYAEIVSSSGDVIDKVIRDLSKRTNHGANYNMGAQVLLDTMGIENVVKAKIKLKLPSRWSLLDVCKYLLQQYDKAYPTVRGPYYDVIKAIIKATHMLESPTGWTRYCFGDPSKSKRDLNRYVAHPSQNLNAMVLNKAWLAVYYNVWMNNKKDFKLHAQIHDSIVFSYRKGRIDLAREVKKQMEIVIDVKDWTYGVERKLLVPVALKGEAERWSEIKKIAA